MATVTWRRSSWKQQERDRVQRLKHLLTKRRRHQFNAAWRARARARCRSATGIQRRYDEPTGTAQGIIGSWQRSAAPSLRCRRPRLCPTQAASPANNGPARAAVGTRYELPQARVTLVDIVALKLQCVCVCVICLLALMITYGRVWTVTSKQMPIIPQKQKNLSVLKF